MVCLGSYATALQTSEYEQTGTSCLPLYRQAVFFQRFIGKLELSLNVFFIAYMANRLDFVNIPSLEHTSTYLRLAMAHLSVPARSSKQKRLQITQQHVHVDQSFYNNSVIVVISYNIKELLNNAQLKS